MDSLQDAELAFSYMLPNATQQVNYLEEESNYFSTQLWKEGRRTVMMDYTMAREAFIDVGEQIQRHIYEINNGWGQFLDFYTDLNNARKEQDDTFVEKNYIGEEIPEPEENPVQEDLFEAYEHDGSFHDDNLSDGSAEQQLLRGRSDSVTTPRQSPNILAELKKEINQEEETKTEQRDNPEHKKDQIEEEL